MSVQSATVSFRTESGVAEDEPWTVVDSAQLSNTVPWRTFPAVACLPGHHGPPVT